MVEVIDSEDDCLHIKINTETPREIIHWRIDSILDSYLPRHIVDFMREAGRKGFTDEEINRTLKEKYNYPLPKQRFRREQTKALDVWEEWVQSGVSAKKGFPKIAKKLDIPLSTVKSRWYKAFELINQIPYDPKRGREGLKGKADELCSNCKDSKCYKESGESLGWIPCPKYIELAGKKYQREKTMSKKGIELSHFGELPEE